MQASDGIVVERLKSYMPRDLGFPGLRQDGARNRVENIVGDRSASRVTDAPGNGNGSGESVPPVRSKDAPEAAVAGINFYDWLLETKIDDDVTDASANVTHHIRERFKRRAVNL